MLDGREIRPIPVIITVVLVALSVVGVWMAIGGGAGDGTLDNSNGATDRVFQVKDLAVYPPQVEPGENVFVGVSVKNPSDNRRTESLKLEVGAEEKTKAVTLGGGEERTITFSVSREIEGKYNVSISNFSGNFRVEVPPPRFKISNLEVSPSQVAPGEKVEVSAVVINVGGSEGGHEVELKVDDDLVETRNVNSLEPGENKTVSFTLDRTDPRSYSVEIGGRLETFVVTPAEPAEFELSNLSVELRADADDFCDYPIGVSLNLANVGGQSGSYTVELQVDRLNKENYDVIEYEVYTDSREVSLDDGESKTVTFKIARDSLDLDNVTYKFSVESLKPQIHTYTLGENSS